MSSKSAIGSIRPEQLHERLEAGEEIELIDVRTPAEYRAVHATIARLEPLASNDARGSSRAIASRRLPADRPLYLICRSGGRSRQACEKLAASGAATVVNVEGGTLAWEKAGLPVERGRGVLPLDRQIRILIGVLVVLGTVLGAFLDPAWLLLAGFMGAGLIFAGLTDYCPLSRCVARMPWNQGSA